MNRVASALAFAVAAALAAPSAHAYVRESSNWNPSTLPISYRINLTSAPASLGSDGARTAVEGAFASWAAPTCTRWRTTDAGTTTVTRASSMDRSNTILWISGSWPAELGDPNSVIGVTTPVWTTGGYFIDADIQFNNVGFGWNMTGTGSTGGHTNVDAQSIATHEEGHFLGLDHTPVASAIMYASYSGGVKRTLTSDDIAGVCAIYPSGGAVPDAGTPPSDPCAAYSSCDGCTPNANCGWCSGSNRCATGTSTGPNTGGCASGWTWQPSDCRAPTSDPCSANTTCGTCTPVNGCGWCGASNSCRSGTQTGPTAGTCATGWAWFQNMCPTGSTGTASFGEPCAQPGDCASGGLCVSDGTHQPFCSRSCDSTDDCTCPHGYHCYPTMSAGLSVCAPGANSCSAGTDAGMTPVDSGNVTPTDSGNEPPDTGTTETDSGNGMQVDSGMMSGRDGGTGHDAGTPGDASGCNCTVPGHRTSPARAPWALLAIALGAVLARRRRD